MNHVATVVLPASEYFENTILNKLADQVVFLKIARLASPLFVKLSQPNEAGALHLIRSLNYFSEEDLHAIAFEWPHYTASCEQMEIDDIQDAPPRTPTSIRLEADYMQKKYAGIMTRCVNFWKFNKYDHHLELGCGGHISEKPIFSAIQHWLLISFLGQRSKDMGFLKMSALGPKRKTR